MSQPIQGSPGGFGGRRQGFGQIMPTIAGGFGNRPGGFGQILPKISGEFKNRQDGCKQSPFPAGTPVMPPYGGPGMGPASPFPPGTPMMPPYGGPGMEPAYGQGSPGPGPGSYRDWAGPLPSLPSGGLGGTTGRVGNSLFGPFPKKQKQQPGSSPYYTL